MNKYYIFLIEKVIPRFIISIFSRLILSLKYKDNKLVFNNKNDNNEVTKDLLICEYPNGVGDFILSLRVFYELYNEGYKFDILVNKKFEGIIEKLNFEDVNIIYKEKSYGGGYLEHTGVKQDDNYMDVYNESMNKCLEYNNIYHFNRGLNFNILLYIMNIKYNKFFSIKYNSDKINRVKSLFICKKFAFLSFFVNAYWRKFKIKFIGGKKFKNKFLSDYSYYLYTNKFPNESLSNIKLDNVFKSNKLIKNSLCIILDKTPRGKALKLEELVRIINNEHNDKTIVFVGTSEKQLNYLKKNIRNKIINYINKTKTVLDYINVVSMCENVLAYDTSLLHIATLLNKNVVLYINEDSYFYKKEPSVWWDYKNIKIKYYKNEFFSYNEI